MTTPSPRSSTRGPRLLLAAGVVMMLLALASVALAAGLMARILPSDVLAADGSAGPGVVAVVEAPGSTTVVLDDGDYAVWLEVPQGQDGAELTGEIEVTGPDGLPVRVAAAPSVTGSTSRGGVHAATVAGFEATAGEHVVTAPSSTTTGARLLVVEDDGFGPFFGGLLGTIASIFLAVGLGAVGLGLTVGGALWLHRRRTRDAAPPAS